MPCGKCGNIEKRKHLTGFGIWSYNCKEYNIGRNYDSDSCMNTTENNIILIDKKGEYGDMESNRFE